jgi:hypothetical protein
LRHSRKRGRRGRGRGRGGGAGTARARAAITPPSQAAGAARSRSEERNAAARATLEPLVAGDRPWALRIAVVLSVLIAIGNVVQAAVGTNVKVGGTRTTVAGSLVFSAVMLVCAGGMWRLRYWAALGFQALLGIVIVAFVFVALTANDVLRLAIAIAVIVAGGALFWKMVRVLSRLQMPKPPGSA